MVRRFVSPFSSDGGVVALLRGGLEALSGEGECLAAFAVGVGEDGRGVSKGEVFVFGSWKPGSMGSTEPFQYVDKRSHDCTHHHHVRRGPLILAYP